MLRFGNASLDRWINATLVTEVRIPRILVLLKPRVWDHTANY